MGIAEVIEQNERKDLLRFLTCGSVDDGKSTLIGRLLHDSKDIYEDHLRSLERDSKRVGSAGDSLDYSLLLDGLKAEREQGITIDVAYRYFSTPKRKFIIADCPGHEQYTRNMATGASTANLAVVLVDARNGVVQQTRRHSFIASLLNIRHIVVAVNKMDLVDYSQSVFEKIRADYSNFASRLEVPDLHFVPISALKGDNVVEQGERMPWHKGPPLLTYLETVHIASDRNFIDLRFPVQYALRQDMSFRGYCGTIASGLMRPGSEVVVLPGGQRTKVKSILTYDGEVAEAFPPMAVTVRVEDDVDISRGDLLVHPNNRPRISRLFDASVVWMAEDPLDPERTYRLKHGCSEVIAQVTDVRYRFNINDLGREPATSLNLNEIGRLSFELSAPLTFDSYKRNRSLGSFVLIDPTSNGTVAAGMILEQDSTEREDSPEYSTHVREKVSRVSTDERLDRLKQKSVTLWLTGLPKSGKTTIAYALERQLFDWGYTAHVLDGENLRLGLSKNLGFTALDRFEHIRRSAHVARLCNEIGLITIVALVSPYETDRAEAGRIIGDDRFLEIYLDTPLDVCEQRDSDGLFDKARRGEIKRFTGISAPYEQPSSPALVISAGTKSVDESVAEIVALLRAQKIL